MMHCKRSSCVSLSAATIGRNDDLLTEILLFLPVKSLIRFKLVSKHWRSLISAPLFSRRHILHHPRRRPQPQHSFILGSIESQFFICNPAIKKLVPISFPFPYVKILQSCNGLFLMECRNSPHGRKDYYIFNPSTMQSRNLHLSRAFSGICLIFDPSKSDHYKVVCFKSAKNSTSFLVYDSETHKWKDGGKSDLGPYKFRDGVYWNGCIYFIRYSEPSFCFSPDDKIYRVPDPPRIWSSGEKKNYITESNGHLHYLPLYSEPDMKILYVLEMNDNDWFIKSRADDSPISAKFAGNNNVTEMDLLGMIRGERIEDSMLLFHLPGKIMVYRFSDGVCEVLNDFTRDYFYQEGQLQFGFKDTHPFIESFAPV